MSKRPSLTLRKPGAGNSDQIEAFIRGGDGSSPEESPVPIAAVDSPVSPLVPVPPVEPAKAKPTRAVASLVQRVEPPQLDGAVSDEDVPIFRRPRKSIIHRKKGSRRRTTVYFDLAVAQQLGHYCVNLDHDMSDVVNDAVVRYLEAKRSS